MLESLSIWRTCKRTDFGKDVGHVNPLLSRHKVKARTTTQSHRSHTETLNYSREATLLHELFGVEVECAGLADLA